MSLGDNQQLQGDLRRVYDIYSRDVKRISIILQTRHPIAPKGSESTGLQCMTAILRRIHSHAMLGPQGLAKADHFKQAEIQNPIIRFSWQMFETDVSTRYIRTTDWAKMKSQLDECGLQTAASFQELCSSSMMNHTYWSQNEMRLLEPKMCLQTWQTINESTEEIASSSLVTLDRAHSPEMTLEQAVESSFGVFRREGKPTLHRPQQPLIIRVLYDPGSGPRLPFRELRGFGLPIWRETQDRQNPFDTSERAQYVLLAVVRMRANPKDKDLVRFYATTGAEIIPEHGLKCLATGWSTEDEDHHRYMLFYSPPGHYLDPIEASAFPEEAGPLIKDDDEVRDSHVLISRAMEPFIEKELSRAATRGSDGPQDESTVEPGEVLGDSSRQVPRRSLSPRRQGANRTPPAGPRENPNSRKGHQRDWQGSSRPAKRPRVVDSVNCMPIRNPRMPELDEDMHEGRG
ncbi:hypothetical protein FPCIR_12916 [Fusarium pseudocircinatum]|uniref:Uncharacterized protein n=1 Tax=Fusarium pseudocircinatum TaxID=56676 RepID=A0A8H5KKC7_9HYPO|nr:hypothetical protein FPCIR_12916 [Fusarium pseudocircinatum]